MVVYKLCELSFRVKKEMRDRHWLPPSHGEIIHVHGMEAIYILLWAHDIDDPLLVQLLL